MPFAFLPLHAQDDDCMLKLQEAEKYYEAGKIEKIPDLLLGCIYNGFNRENKVRALRLLTLAYISDDNMNDADRTMLQILRTNPEFETNASLDPLEFIRLYESYDTDPIFSVGVHFSFNQSYPMLIEAIGANAFNEINPHYTPQGFHFSGGLNFTYHLNPKIDLVFDPMLESVGYGFEEAITTEEVVNGEETMTSLNFPVLASYNFFTWNELRFMVEGGLSYNYYLNGELSLTNTYLDGENPDYSDSPFSTEDIRNHHMLAGIAGLGAKVNLPRSYLRVGVRYTAGLTNVVKTNTDSDVQNTMNWVNRYQDNYFRPSNVALFVSFNYEIYQHKKK